MEPRFHSTTLLHDVVPNKSHGRDYCCVILREDFERLWKEAVAVYRRNRPIICLEDWRESARNVKIGNVGGNSGTQKLINSLVWENGYSQLIDGPTRGDALLDVFLVRPESSLTSSGIVQGGQWSSISDSGGGMEGHVQWTPRRKGSPGIQQNRCLRLTNFPPR